MMPLAPLLVSIAGPFIKRALTALGIGVISYAAVQTALSAAVSQVQGAYGSIAGDIAGPLGLAGFGEAIGIILGALSARLAATQLTKLGLLKK